jgi:hypothetical protein
VLPNKNREGGLYCSLILDLFPLCSCHSPGGRVMLSEQRAVAQLACGQSEEGQKQDRLGHCVLRQVQCKGGVRSATSRPGGGHPCSWYSPEGQEVWRYFRSRQRLQTNWHVVRARRGRCQTDIKCVQLRYNYDRACVLQLDPCPVNSLLLSQSGWMGWFWVDQERAPNCHVVRATVNIVVRIGECVLHMIPPATSRCDTP